LSQATNGLPRPDKSPLALRMVTVTPGDFQQS